METPNTPFVDIQAILASPAPDDPSNPFTGIDLTTLSHEKRMEMAIKYLEDMAAVSASKPLSQRQICKLLSLDRGTLQGRLKGARSKAIVNAEKSLFTEAESGVIIDLITSSASQGFPLTNASLEDVANYILLAKHCGLTDPTSIPRDDTLFRDPTANQNAPKVGKNWADRWLQKYGEKVKTFWSGSLDSKRARAINPTSIGHWFSLMREVYVREGDMVADEDGELSSVMPPERIFGMDETCGWGNTAAKVKVIGATGSKNHYVTRAESRESTTLIVTVCATGQVLKPFCIFAAAKLRSDWTADNPLDAKCGVSPTSYTNDELALLWIDHFNEQTAHSAGGKSRILFLDGHRSHHTLEFLFKARSLHIVCLGFPPNGTHVLQPLDVVGFAQFKKAWRDLLHDNPHLKPTKLNYLRMIASPFAVAFSESNVKKGFSKTGIFPLNATKITPDMMAPSLPYSINTYFPLPQPSPVRAIVRHLDLHTITSAMRTLNLEGDHPAVPSPPPSSPLGTPIIEATPFFATEIIESHPLQNTSAAYLLDSAPMPENVNLAPPLLYNLPKTRIHLPPSVRSKSYVSKEALIAQNAQLRNQIQQLGTQNEHLHTTVQIHETQLAVQYLHVRKMKRSNAETARPPRATLMQGLGHELTGSDFTGRVQAAKDASQAVADAVEARKVAREQKKVRTAACEEEWKRVKAAHGAAMNAYKASLKNVHFEPLDKPSKLKLKAVIIAEFELAMGWSMELTPDEPLVASIEAPVASTVVEENFQAGLDAIVDETDEEGSEYNPHV